MKNTRKEKELLMILFKDRQVYNSNFQKMSENLTESYLSPRAKS